MTRELFDWEVTEEDRCKVHEEYVNGCPGCFAEAVDGGVGIIQEGFPGAEIVEMPAAGPFHRVFELRFEGERVFAFTYREGEALCAPERAQEAVDQLLDANRQNVEYWDARIAHFREAGDGDGEHRALKARGVAGARLDKVENWTLGVFDKPRKAPAESRLLPRDDEPRRAV